MKKEEKIEVCASSVSLKGDIQAFWSIILCQYMLFFIFEQWRVHISNWPMENLLLRKYKFKGKVWIGEVELEDTSRGFTLEVYFQWGYFTIGAYLQREGYYEGWFLSRRFYHI